LTAKRRENVSVCPQLAPLEDGIQQPRPSSQRRCIASGTACAVSVRRQMTSCLGPGYGNCPEYREVSPQQEDQDPSESSVGSWDGALAEGALVSLMIAMIVFVLFAMAPRPMPPASRANQPVATQTEKARETASTENPSPTAVVQLAAQPALPTATPVAPTRTPVSTQAPRPTIVPDRTYVVMSGDTLFSIARSLGVTVESLAKANGLSDPRLLRAGQKLRVP
jgi:LysM repeat protein